MITKEKTVKFLCVAITISLIIANICAPIVYTHVKKYTHYPEHNNTPIWVQIWVGLAIFVAPIVLGIICYLIYRTIDNKAKWWCTGIRHKWVGCKCERCCKTRDEQHDWDVCVCRRCGKTKPVDENLHDWDGCVCRHCGKERHDWDGCKCKRCGTRRDDDVYNYDTPSFGGFATEEEAIAWSYI